MRKWLGQLFWTLVSAVLGAALGAAAVVLYFGPHEEQRDLALAESTLLTQLLFSCTSDLDPDQYILRNGDAVYFPEDYDRLVSIESLVRSRNLALDQMRHEPPAFDLAIRTLARARSEYLNSECYRDFEWEDKIRVAQFCDVIDNRDLQRRWFAFGPPGQRDRCGTGEASDLLFCDAIRSDGQYRASEGRTASTRLQQACGADRGDGSEQLTSLDSD